MKRILCVFLVGLILSPSLALAEITTIEKAGKKEPFKQGGKTGADMIQEEWFGDRVICVDGLKLFQTVGPGWGAGANPAISTIQLYEERDGKVVPAKCK